MQQQYLAIKQEYRDHILLFRLGDFYEVFHEDAVTVSKILGITLTGRGKGEDRYPMAGIPHHALPAYLPKLTRAGLKIAIADQTEEASPGKLVEREVTKIVTPGTIIDENSLDSSRNNYIASLYLQNDKASLAFYLVYADLTTGELKAFITPSALVLKNELHKVNPAEILCPASQTSEIEQITHHRIEKLNDAEYAYNENHEILVKQFKTTNLRGFGIDDQSPIVNAAGALLRYLQKNQKTEIRHITAIQKYSYTHVMQLDSETIRNLELLHSMIDGDEKNSLYHVLNKCENSMGKRKLRHFLLHPLTDTEMLQDRFDAVDFFFQNSLTTLQVRESLSNMADIERITGRIGLGNANPKDVYALKLSIEQVLNLTKMLNQSDVSLPRRIAHLIKQVPVDQLSNLCNLIHSSIQEDPPAMIHEGGIFVDGYNQEVDEYRSIKTNAKNILAEIQVREVAATGISSLKISFNKVFGYYIEVTNTHRDKVPDSYIRKQTLTNAERYITQELKDLEDKILHSEENLIALELSLYKSFLDEVASFVQDILHTADIFAELDVLSNFGHIARQYQYVKPILGQQNEHSIFMQIRGGRHPVVEHLTKPFIANDTAFEEESLIHILTGPNMSGKSTYIRQVAIITLLAQIGSFVPANEMVFTPVDRVFTRVGASDNLAKGESTFMVEMTETANILNNATKKSLVILDEVGRGTSTYDGVAIAWSIVEYLEEKIQCKTLFATHYHELIALEHGGNHVKNFNVQVVEDNGEIVFQHSIISGSTNRSYGVHVAKLAGVPKEVVERANEILDRFEGNGNSADSIKDSREEKVAKTAGVSKAGPKRPKQMHPEQLGLI